MNNSRIVFTATAKEDLRSIALYIAEQSGSSSIAIGFVNELRDKCEILKTFPESGALPKDRVLISIGYRFLVYKDYLIFYMYRQEENTAYISAIFNSKRDYYRYMKRFQ